MRIKSAKRQTPIIKKQLDPRTEKRNTIIKAVAAGIAFIVAVIAFSTFARQCTNVNSGWQVVSPNSDTQSVLFASGKSLNYDFQGTSSEMRVEMKELKSAYTTALAHINKLLDPINTYEGYTNLAYINARRGQEVKVSPELYSVLKSAYELTEEGMANIFGGALYHEWQSITVLDDSASADPLNDPDEQERINEIAAMTADLNNFTLEFIGSDTVKFTVSDEYRAMMQRLEIDAPVLDACFLREAYELEYTAQELEKGGFKRGFITTVGGMTRCLSQAEGGFIVAYAPNGSAVSDVFKVPMTGNLMCCTLRAYSYGSDDLEYYSVESAGSDKLRHPHYDLATGEVNDALLTVMVTAEEGDFVRLCAKSYAMICAKDVNAAKAEFASLEPGVHAAFIAKESADTICADPAFDSIIPSDNMKLEKA